LTWVKEGNVGHKDKLNKYNTMNGGMNVIKLITFIMQAAVQWKK
jgi:hypothetical protein